MATIEQIKLRNAQAGLYFFSKDTMRFFNSRVSSKTFLRNDGSTLFVTSEQHGNEQRCYTIRLANLDGTISDFSKFQEYATLAQALRDAEIAAKG
jgi:hypothetical protein